MQLQILLDLGSLPKLTHFRMTKINHRIFEHDSPDWTATLTLTKKELLDLRGNVAADRDATRSIRPEFIKRWEDTDELKTRLELYDKNLDFLEERLEYITQTINENGLER